MNLKLISIVLFAAIASACISGSWNNGTNVRYDDGQLKKFNSISEIESFLKKNTESRNY